MPSNILNGDKSCTEKSFRKGKQDGLRERVLNFKLCEQESLTEDDI